MSEVDFGRGRSKQDLKADIETALRRHGIDIPGGMVDAYAEMAAAATGSRLMVLPR